MGVPLELGRQHVLALGLFQKLGGALERHLLDMAAADRAGKGAVFEPCHARSGMPRHGPSRRQDRGEGEALSSLEMALELCDKRLIAQGLMRIRQCHGRPFSSVMRGPPRWGPMVPTISAAGTRPSALRAETSASASSAATAIMRPPEVSGEKSAS